MITRELRELFTELSNFVLLCLCLNLHNFMKITQTKTSW